MVDIKTEGNISGIPGAAKEVGGFKDTLRKEIPDVAEGIIKLVT